MDSEDPITPDASTIFRSRDTPAPQSDGSASTQKPSVDADPKKIENAKTVIRAPKPVPQTPPRSPGRTPAAVTKILLGRNLDHFRLEEMIGGGGMGAVFRAHDDSWTEPLRSRSFRLSATTWTCSVDLKTKLKALRNWITHGLRVSMVLVIMATGTTSSLNTSEERTSAT